MEVLEKHINRTTEDFIYIYIYILISYFPEVGACGGCVCEEKEGEEGVRCQL